MGRVRSKSNRAAFSNSSARDGGANASEATATAEREEDRDTNWGFVSFGRFAGILGMEIWSGILGFGIGVEGEEEMGTLDEAMIMLAMAEGSAGFCAVLWIFGILRILWDFWIWGFEGL